MLVERQSERLLAQAHAPALKCRTSYLHYCQSLFALIRVNSWIVCCRIKTIHELTRINTIYSKARLRQSDVVGMIILEWTQQRGRLRSQ